MNNTNLDLIRQKCIEANPEIMATRNCTHPNCQYAEHTFSGRSIRLADVLLAIFEADAEERADELIHGSVKVWNLRKDHLNEQSEETIDFLADLLR
jgi:hypothetical protein